MNKSDKVDSKKESTAHGNMNDEERKDLLSWWSNLHENKGVCAALRRCSTPGEASLFLETVRLGIILKRFKLKAGQVAAAAGVLSHVKPGEGTVSNQHFACLLAMPAEGGSKAVFSESRFRRLVNSRGIDELFTALRRAVKIVKGDVNPLSIVDGIILWSKGRKYTAGAASRFQLKWSHQYFEQLLKNEN